MPVPVVCLSHRTDEESKKGGMRLTFFETVMAQVHCVDCAQSVLVFISLGNNNDNDNDSVNNDHDDNNNKTKGIVLIFIMHVFFYILS